MSHVDDIDYRNPENNVIDPYIHKRNNWYSTTKGGQVNPISGESYDYCEFCYYNFKQYNECVNNICQSCGRPADFMTRNKQQMIKINALNAAPSEATNRGVAMEIDYTPLLEDQTVDKSKPRIGEHMQTAGGAGEAMRMIRDSERVVDRNGQSYKVKTTYKEKPVEFDKKDY